MDAYSTGHDVLRKPGQPLGTDTRARLEPGFGHDFSRVRLHNHAGAAGSAHVHRQGGGAGGVSPGQGAGISPTPCTQDEVTRTSKLAEAARRHVAPWVPAAHRALQRLHSQYITHKSEIAAGAATLGGEVVCAFDSNFNIDQRDPQYGVAQIRVMRRLGQLERKIGAAVSYECAPDGDPICVQAADGATEAYVVNGAPPIHFCKPFRDSFELMGRRATLLHEFAHLLPGVRDEGGYAMPFAQAMTCARGVKFTAESDVLTSTADALAGFVLHLGQKAEEAAEASASGGRR